jgi:hypothetical protein
VTIEKFSADLTREIRRRRYFIRLEIIEQTTSQIKARLFISQNLFVQIYRNNRFETTNFALIHNELRIFARDQLAGIWHRHAYAHPDKHDFSDLGSKPVTLGEFLDEVETLLSELNLP